LLWAAAIGAHLSDPTCGLEGFRQVTPAILAAAGALLDTGQVSVEVDPSQRDLLVDCRVARSEGSGRAVIELEHARLVRLEANGEVRPLPTSGVDTAADNVRGLRKELAYMPFPDMIEIATNVDSSSAELLTEGVKLNVEIAQHGLSHFPRRFFQMMGDDSVTRLSRLVCAGVFSRMSGDDYTVMTLAASGNKGITVAVPLFQWGEDNGHPKDRIHEALALACLVTSATTHNLGTLSAVCGCSNAAGIGLAAGLVHLEGGDAEHVSLAMNNMVGNVTGMICDGAKIGCAMKTMTSVDAAFRSAALALSGIGIPETDGIIGKDGKESLWNLGRIARIGMTSTDSEILKIMQEKLRG